MRLWKSGSAIQAGWLCFTLVAVALACYGVTPYLDRVVTPCDEYVQHCLALQMSSAEMQSMIATGIMPTLGDAQLLSLNVAFGAVFAILIAAFGIWRRPTVPAVVWMSFGLTALGTSELIQAWALETPAFQPLTDALHAVQVAGLVLCFALAPTDRFPRAWLGWLTAGTLVLGGFVAYLPARPLVSGPFAVAVVILCMGSLTMRLRTLTAPAEREQVMWGLIAFSLLAGAQVIGKPLRLLPFPTLSPGETLLVKALMPTGGLVLLLGGIACLAVALLRDELTQLELVFNRTLVYGILTLFVVGSYGMIVGSLSLIFQATGSFWLSLGATGLVAVLFQPLRAWVQRLVNQLLYGQRDDPMAVLARLGERLEVVQTADALLPDLARTIAQVLKLPYVAIALRQGTENVPMAEFCMTANGHESISASLLTIPLIHQRETIGELRIAPRSPDDPFSAAERELLINIARQAGAAVRAVQLTADLQQSRQGLVSVIEEERRRLRRDLHDGLGPVLAALILQSETAHDLVRQDPAEAESLLLSMADQAQAATQEIRRLVYNLRPPALDDLGLMSALRAHTNRYATSGVHFEICVPEPLLPLPAAVEVAVYRIAIEAITNVIRHAHATYCWVTLEVDATQLNLTVGDDGRGLPVGGQVGVGLLSMRERCAELGGNFTLTDQNGVQIRATLPL